MPFKSEAQRRKFHQLVREGKMSQSTVDKWEKETGSKRLPDHAPGRSRAKTKVIGRVPKSQRGNR